MGLGPDPVIQHPVAPRPVELLVTDLIEHSDWILTAAELKRLGPAGAQLLHWGGFQESDQLRAIYCQSCGEDHEVALEFNAATWGYRYYCSSDGFVNVGDDEVQAFQFSVEWLVQRLSESLQVRRPRYRELVPNILWDLGDADLTGAGSKPWATFLARAVSLSLDGIVDALQVRGRKLPGVVLTTSPGAPWQLALPHGYRFVALTDVLEVQTGALEVALDALLPRLHGRVANKGQKRGPHTNRGTVLDLFERRRRAGLTLPQVGREAETIAAELAPGMQHAPRGRAVGTVENHIRDAHRAWRGEGPRSTN
jgi:hypothetical protein